MSQTIAKGIRRHGAGWQGSVFVRGKRVFQSFPIYTPMEEIKHWQTMMKARLQLGQPGDVPWFPKVTSYLPLLTQSSGYVYFLQQDRMVKIGRARDLKERLRALQCGQASKLKLVAVFRCDRPIEVERAIHEHFDHLRESGEWFHLSEELIEAIRVTSTGGSPLFRAGNFGNLAGVRAPVGTSE